MCIDKTLFLLIHKNGWLLYQNWRPVALFHFSCMDSNGYLHLVSTRRAQKLQRLISYLVLGVQLYPWPMLTIPMTNVNKTLGWIDRGLLVRQSVWRKSCLLKFCLAIALIDLENMSILPISIFNFASKRGQPLPGVPMNRYKNKDHETCTNLKRSSLLEGPYEGNMQPIPRALLEGSWVGVILISHGWKIPIWLGLISTIPISNRESPIPTTYLRDLSFIIGWGGMGRNFQKTGIFS